MQLDFNEEESFINKFDLVEFKSNKQNIQNNKKNSKKTQSSADQSKPQIPVGKHFF